MSDMLTNQAIPIHIGVTGHRDIPLDDIPKLEAELLKRFQELRASYPSTPFRLLSGLAEGADRIVAKLALQSGIELIAVLPMPIEEYLKDFPEESSQLEFTELLSRASFLHTCLCDLNEGRENGYARQGFYIVRHSQLVIALWDGVNEQIAADGSTSILTGGTADVVRMCTAGIKSDDGKLLTAPEETPVEHLLTRRVKHAQLATAPFTPDAIATWQRADTYNAKTKYSVMAAIDAFNKDTAAIAPTEKETSIHYLLGDTPPEGVRQALGNLLNVFGGADSMAGLRQRQRSNAIRWISFIAILSILFQQIYSGPDMRWGWLLMHVFLAMSAFGLFLFFFRGHHHREDQFVEWRVLAEGLRVQVFWLACGLPNVAADYYRTNRLNEMDWITQSIRNLTMTIKPFKVSGHLDWIQKTWLENQQTYFAEKAKHNATKSKKLDALARRFFMAASIVTIATLAMHLEGVALDWLNYAVLVSGMLFVTSALTKTYGEQMGFDGNARRYERSAIIFQQAFVRFANATNANDQTMASQIILTIGQEALSENAAWLQMNRMNQFEVSIS